MSTRFLRLLCRCHLKFAVSLRFVVFASFPIPSLIRSFLHFALLTRSQWSCLSGNRYPSSLVVVQLVDAPRNAVENTNRVILGLLAPDHRNALCIFFQLFICIFVMLDLVSAHVLWERRK